MERRAIAIRGTVQGVGFRPYVYGLASSLDLGGFVRNHTGGVTIEVEGDSQSLETFVTRLIARPPPLARIDEWSCEHRAPLGDVRFQIESSETGSPGAVAVAPDAATCDDCLAELFDPHDRRYRYPFLNCTNCGPRLTIVTGVPYDRERTTMSGFAMCPRCREEYDDPSNRRFHAQPTACADCGPKLALIDNPGERIETIDPLACFVRAISAGRIGAMKGIGGYHLVCDARNAAAVAELRRRKHRDEKPFAVMVRDLEAAHALCDVDPAPRDLLTDPRRPIVLLPKRGNNGLADMIAPGNPRLGLMLPYAPLHHLLLHDMNGAALVMTSGNRSDEPIAYREPEAFDRLKDIADVFLTHDRPIRVRCDDSVTRVIGGVELPIRRSRGYAPQSIQLPMTCPVPILAVGGQLKGTFALGSDRRAVLSHHLGDLDHLESYRAFEKDVALYERLFQLIPTCVAHDMHPDYTSTGYAKTREAASGVKLVAVQHHHAHMASCMAEHALGGPVIGVTLDGSGFGTDGAIWGGEFLVGGYHSFQRAAHLRYIGMPGGEMAVREPWRMAAAHLLDAEASCGRFENRIPAALLATARQMLRRRFNTPMTSSAGRLFDAVASLAGIRDRVNYEGQAAIELEWIAGMSPSPGTLGEGLGEGQPALSRSTGRGESSGPYPFDLLERRDGTEPIEIDTRPLIRDIARDVETRVTAELIARRFHLTMVQIIIDICRRLRVSTGIGDVVLSGGVFMNALLSVAVEERLSREGLTVYRHRLVPPNDGGLCLGQLAVAAARLSPLAAWRSDERRK